MESEDKKKSPSLVYLPRSEDADYPRNALGRVGGTSEFGLNRIRFRAPSEAQGELFLQDLSHVLLEQKS